MTENFRHTIMKMKKFGQILFNFVAIGLFAFPVVFSAEQIAAFAQDEPQKDARFYENEAMNAFKAQNLKAFLDNIKQAVVLSPNHSRMLYRLAAAQTLNDQPSEAVRTLDKIASMGLIYNPDKDEIFASLKNDQSFNAVIEKFAENKKPVGKSVRAFDLDQKDLIIESLAFDTKTETFYLGSIHKRKIISVDKNGAVKEFADESDGLWSAMGMKVDANRRHLWVCTAAHPQMSNFKSEENGMSAVIKFDLKSGKVLKKYLLPNQPKKHWFGDLTISKSGDVFITDSLNPAIYRISRKKDKLEVFIENDLFSSLQGLDLSPDQKHLFIADYSKGLFAIDVKTKNIKPLPFMQTTTLGIDGLYFYKDGLIAIQNGTNPNRVLMFYLNENFDEIVRYETIEANNPDFNDPTLGVLVGNSFFYNANSQWGSIDQKGQLAPADKLSKPLVLKVEF